MSLNPLSTVTMNLVGIEDPIGQGRILARIAPKTWQDYLA